MGRSPCCTKEGLNKGTWTALEDQLLTDYIKTHGEGKWGNIPKKTGKLVLEEEIISFMKQIGFLLVYMVLHEK